MGGGGGGVKVFVDGFVVIRGKKSARVEQWQGSSQRGGILLSKAKYL